MKKSIKPKSIISNNQGIGLKANAIVSPVKILTQQYFVYRHGSFFYPIPGYSNNVTWLQVTNLSGAPLLVQEFWDMGSIGWQLKNTITLYSLGAYSNGGPPVDRLIFLSPSGPPALAFVNCVIEY